MVGSKTTSKEEGGDKFGEEKYKLWLGLIWEKALDLVYPSNIYCACCGDAIDPDMPYSLCSRCVREIHWIYHEIPTQSADGAKKHLFQRGFSCARYESRTKEMLRRFKYAQKPYLRKALGKLMLERVAHIELNVDMAAPVPMHRGKERVRGYNQAALLAEEIGDGLGIPCYNQLLQRKKVTGAMSALSAEDRRVNLKEAFLATDYSAVFGKRILLVDDIMTTGTTADECSGALLEAGAEAVILLVFASGDPESE